MSEILDRIATMQSAALDRLMAGSHEPLPPLYHPDYANYGCMVCGGTGMLADDIQCGCRHG